MKKLIGFVDLDTIGISDNETLLYHKFIDNTKFENNRYAVALRFKENRLRGYPLSTYSKFSEKLTFLTP